ncbi:fructokinase [Acetobacter nitrogenifigens DSM 23921 = NBRC 105050]|uniref:Fructokinase n=1 Tax=Acetobacter nitrogenifigens DSM 23921 = NBRC 105050 TaxID=1120919 RepID=A0A511XCB7_9PROT|nr:ROK family protein [Acetobacter nitrogenifigens]GBQ94235.1 fructokinase [Acetobacter nitrogenifigens DSM 23921 = NBRC 105050]GEN60525.1 fructokinase [Acetobacter nitrogenifigens DSM 23921 = NBRC 105050]
MNDWRLGIDVGATKIEIVALDRTGEMKLRRRVPNPGQYDALLTTIRDLSNSAADELGASSSSAPLPIGVGIPGSTDASSGLVKNANATWLNGKPFERDLPEVAGRPARVENDANCFALSEAIDGAAAGKNVVFGVIIGSGMGGGLVVNGKLVSGLNHVAGEWGHTPLPWPRLEEFPMPKCFCGNEGCLERFLCGSALAEDWQGPGHRSVEGIEDAAANGDARAVAALDRYVDRFARACAMLINILDPNAIVLGGGVSNIRAVRERTPGLLQRHVVTPDCKTPILGNKHGDSSGVRGAAWLWEPSETTR